MSSVPVPLLKTANDMKVLWKLTPQFENKSQNAIAYTYAKASWCQYTVSLVHLR